MISLPYLTLLPLSLITSIQDGHPYQWYYYQWHVQRRRQWQQPQKYKPSCQFIAPMLLTAKFTIVTLYTNHVCPWAHRAHITLRALKIPYEEVIIPLDRPRDPWYLEINPRGLVPAIKITTADGKLKDDIITESAIVATFLADLFPHPTFWPRSEEDPLKRARINYFVDTWFSKVNSFMVPMLKAEGEEKEKVAGDLVAAIEKEIEPLLENAAPFFGGSESLTLAEV